MTGRSPKASIVKLSHDRYRVFVSAGRGLDGRRRRISRTVHGSRRKAEEAKLALLVEAGGGGIDMTLGEYAAQVYLPARAAALKPRSYQTVADRLRLYVMPTFGDARLDGIAPRHVRQWLAAFLKPSVRFVAYSTLRQLLNRAVRDECLAASPLGKVDAPPRGRYEPDVLDVWEAEVYLWHFEGSPVYDAVLLALGGGFRRGEIAALDWADITPGGVVTVDDAIVQHGGMVTQTTPKSLSGVRRVTLPGYILKRLRLAERPAGAVLTEGGERMRPDRITQLYRQRLRTLPDGVARVPLKNLRHSSLSLAYYSGPDILSVSRRAGHSTTAITEQYYLRPQGSRDDEAARLMDEAFGACQFVPNNSENHE
jgi:integrase